MSKKIRFGIEIEFDAPVKTKEDVEEIAKKILIALTEGFYRKGYIPKGTNLNTKYIRVGDSNNNLVCDCQNKNGDGD